MAKMINVNIKGLALKGERGPVVSNTHKEADFSSRLSSAIGSGARANVSANASSYDVISASDPHQAAKRHVSETNLNGSFKSINSQSDLEEKNTQADIEEKRIEDKKVAGDNAQENKTQENNNIEESVNATSFNEADLKAQAQVKVTQLLSQLTLASQLNEDIDGSALNTKGADVSALDASTFKVSSLDASQRAALETQSTGFKSNEHSIQKAVSLNAQGQWRSGETLDVAEQVKQGLVDENKASSASSSGLNSALISKMDSTMGSTMASTVAGESAGESSGESSSDNRSGLLSADSRLKGELSLSQLSLNTREGNERFVESTQGQSRSLFNTDVQGALSLKTPTDPLPSMQNMIMRFSPAMQQQLVTMVSQGVQQAEIRLDPAELGQMMVRIQVQGDTTQVQFQVNQAQTRDLIEQALPRLKDMLAEQGMQLSEGQVSYQDSHQGSYQESHQESESDQQQRGEHILSAQDLAKRNSEASFESDSELWTDALNNRGENGVDTLKHGIDDYA
ncbi:flagellar hook-length control protein FliK [uncultured Shewanella sp.]|uniref:flagellar hook-length control protein FliK n=1 Tax=uncultured Shewanella sp. TaxID=173975 RepID=UPI002623B96A|nr:flagellar hook-length control protein FliK [uncultured Shewanella sp.]